MERTTLKQESKVAEMGAAIASLPDLSPTLAREVDESIDEEFSTGEVFKAFLQNESMIGQATMDWLEGSEIQNARDGIGYSAVKTIYSDPDKYGDVMDKAYNGGFDDVRSDVNQH